MVNIVALKSPPARRLSLPCTSPSRPLNIHRTPGFRRYRYILTSYLLGEREFIDSPTNPKSPPPQTRLRRHYSFFSAAELCQAWAPFGGPADQLSYIAVLLSLASAETCPMQYPIALNSLASLPTRLGVGPILDMSPAYRNSKPKSTGDFRSIRARRVFPHKEGMRSLTNQMIDPAPTTRERGCAKERIRKSRERDKRGGNVETTGKGQTAESPAADLASEGSPNTQRTRNPPQSWLRRHYRFVLAAELPQAWAPFGGLSAQLRYIAVLLSMASTNTCPRK